MALTKVQTIGIETGISLAGVTTVVTLNASGNLTAVDGTFTGNVSVAGTLTYEDVTNVDSVGLITARNGVSVTGGDFKVGSATTISQDNIFTTGIVTATSFYGDGSNLTGIDATQIVTGDTSVQTTDTGSDGTIKFNTDGSERARIDSSGRLLVGTTSSSVTVTAVLQGNSTDAIGASHLYLQCDQTNPVTNSDLGYVRFADGNGSVFAHILGQVDATSGSSDYPGRLIFATTADGASSPTERLRISANGNIEASGQVQLSDGTAGSPGLTFSSDGGADTGIFRPGADTLAFSTGGSERARIDSSGRLLVGLTSARNVGNNGGGEAPIQAETPNGLICGINLIQNRNGDTIGPYLRFAKTRGSTVGSVTVVQSGDEIGGIQFCGADGTDLVTRGAEIQAYVDTTPGSNDMPGRLVFSTTPNGYASPSEAMRIDSAQQISMNAYSTSAGTACLSLRQNTNSSNHNGIFQTLRSNANNTSTYHFRGLTESASNYFIYGNATAAASSDERLKKNIETTRDGYLTDIRQLRVVKFNWKTHEDGTPRELGLIAQEVEQVFPGLIQSENGQVSEDDPTSYKVLKHSVLPFILLKALQEADQKIDDQSALIEAQAAQLTSQAASIASLEARLTALEGQ